MWGISSNSLQHCTAAAPVPTILLGLLCPWTWGFSSKSLQCCVRNPGKGAHRAREGKDESRVHFELSYVQNASLKRHCHNLTLMLLELDMEQQTDSKSEKEYIKAVYCHPVYLTYMQSTSWGMLDWMKYKLQSRLPGEISITSDMQMTLPLWQKAKNN